MTDPRPRPQIDDTNEFVFHDPPAHTEFDDEPEKRADSPHGDVAPVSSPSRSESPFSLSSNVHYIPWSTPLQPSTEVDVRQMPQLIVPDSAPPGLIPTAEPRQSVVTPTDDSEAPIDGGASPGFTALLQRVISHNNYPTDPILNNYPEMKSNRIENKPSVHRLPPNDYVIQKLEWARINMENSAQTKTQYLKPPSTLERVAETGDALRHVEAADKSRSIRVVRDIPGFPKSFLHILADGKGTELSHSSKVKFATSEAKAIELASIWALKSVNYLDHFQALLDDVLSKSTSQVRPAITVV